MSADNPLLFRRELVIPVPPVAGDISHERVPRDDGSEIELDAYYPATSPTARNPAVVIASGYRDTGFKAAVGCRFKDMGWTKSWVRLFASLGIAAFVYSPRDVEEDFAAIVRAVAAHTRVNSSRVGVFASSGHSPIALTSMMRQFPVAVSCVSLLYGYTLDVAGESLVAAAAKMFKFENGCAGRSLADLRSDIPVLLARAGKDEMPGLNESLDSFAAALLDMNAPLTLVNHAAGQHAFDLFNDSRRTRSVISSILHFVRAALRDERTIPRRH